MMKRSNEWKQYIKNIESNQPHEIIIKSAFHAFKSDYPQNYLEVINDKGVKLVQEKLKESIQQKIENKAEFLFEVDKTLALNQANSVFANLAKKTAWQVLQPDYPKFSNFQSQYIITIMSYFWTRDLVTHFGSRGNVNFVSTDNFLSSMSSIITKKSREFKTIEDLVQDLSN